MTSQVHNRALGGGGQGMQQLFHKDWVGLSSLPPSRPLTVSDVLFQGLCCCPNLKLFASSSRDGSVKIWDHKNRLLR